MPEKLTFGVEYDKYDIGHSADYECLKGCSFKVLTGDFKKDFSHVVGIQEISGNKELELFPNTSHLPFIAIVECPHCFEKFWFHESLNWVNFFWKFKEGKL